MSDKPIIGYGLCGSFCTHAKSLGILEQLTADYRVIPFVSSIVAETDTRFGKAADTLEILEKLCGHPVLQTIPETEPLGPKVHLDAMVIAPCTGNTLAKLAHGITDTCVTMAAKAHLRADRPLLLAAATNDAMSANLGNIGILLNRKNIYFVPMRQDDVQGKPHSLVAEFDLLPQSLACALAGVQKRPLFLA
ncbi:MAG: dipicolinate synthase subunit B [Ruminococcaceae bacterium]|nr:dipicolinate synthase subunit B [Oscillospiraceae bacterium]